MSKDSSVEDKYIDHTIDDRELEKVSGVELPEVMSGKKRYKCQEVLKELIEKTFKTLQDVL